jgi:hypothetical protein
MKKNEILAFASKMHGTGEHHPDHSLPGSEDQKSYDCPHMQTLDLGKRQ